MGLSEINSELIEKAQKLSKSKTKKETVELALKNFIALLKRKQMLQLKGKIHWEGDLNEMRKA